MNKKKLVSALIVAGVVGGLALASTTAMADTMSTSASADTVATTVEKAAEVKKTKDRIKLQINVYKAVQPVIAVINENISVKVKYKQVVSAGMIFGLAMTLRKAGYPEKVDKLLFSSFDGLTSNKVNKAKESFSEALNELNKINTENLKLQAVTQ